MSGTEQGHKIGPFATKGQCVESQQAATVPTSGWFKEGDSYYYYTYPSSSASADDEDSSLREQLEAVGRRFDVLPDLLESSNRVLDEHDLGGISKRLDGIRKREGKKPPDDLYEELKKLAEKLERLRTEKVYERKLPWRRQISLAHLISILVEILDILRKLYERSVPRGGPST